MHRKITATCVAIMICLGLTSQTFAQSMPKEKQAEVAFELRLDKLRGTEMYKMMQGQVDQMAEQANVPDELDLEKVNRIFLVIALPESMADFEAMGDLGDGDELPIEAMGLIEFEDSTSLTEALSQIEKESETVEKDGKTWYKPANGKGPSNMMVTKLNDTTLVGGTTGYLEAGFESVLSKGLAESWEVTPEEPLRISVDLDNARDLMDEAIAEGKANDQTGMLGGFLDLLNKTRSIRISMDVKDGGNLLTLGMTGTDDESAEEVRKGVDSMLGMAKMFGGQGVQEMKAQNEDMGNALETIMNSLNATRDGDKIEIAIPKPEGFEKAVKGMIGGGGDF